MDERTKAERLEDLNIRKMNSRQVEAMRTFLNDLLKREGKEVEKLSRVQAERTRELIWKTLYDKWSDDPEKKYAVICAIYDFSEVPPVKHKGEVKAMAYIAFAELRNNEKFKKKLKKLVGISTAKSLFIPPA